MRPVLAIAAIILSGCATSVPADLANAPKGDLWLSAPPEHKIVYIKGYIAGNTNAFTPIAQRAWENVGMPHVVTPEDAERLQDELRIDMLREEDATALLREMDAIYATPENRGMLAVYAMQIAADRINGRDSGDLLALYRRKSAEWLRRQRAN